MIPAVRHVGPFTLQTWEARTAGPLLAAVAFLIVLTVPVIDEHMDPGVRAAVQVLDVLIWLAFAVDYAFRLYLAPHRWLFVRTHVPDALMVARKSSGVSCRADACSGRGGDRTPDHSLVRRALYR